MLLPHVTPGTSTLDGNTTIYYRNCFATSLEQIKYIVIIME